MRARMVSMLHHHHPRTLLSSSALNGIFNAAAEQRVPLNLPGLCTGRPIIVINGELDRIRTGYYPFFWARTEMQYLKSVIPDFMQVCIIRDKCSASALAATFAAHASTIMPHGHGSQLLLTVLYLYSSSGILHSQLQGQPSSCSLQVLSRPLAGWCITSVYHWLCLIRQI